ncbi:MAG: helix-turn-helix domain-containing protein [Anaerolineae bacterium]|nr:helix-turn-helix domain-containing protein [Anaerolineae bacterium]
MSTNGFISVKEAIERYGYSGSHIRNLLSKGLIQGEKFANVWMVDPASIERYRAHMEELGNKKHGMWANSSGLASSNNPG